MSLADQEYLSIVKNILDKGALGENRTGMPAYKLPHQIMQFDLEKEFPILTTKFVAFKTAVKEILWIWQKQSNDVRELQKWNCHVWDEWMREDGTIGKAYGYQLGKYHQVDTLLDMLKKDPESRRMVVDLWNVKDLPDMALYPCAYSMTFNVSNGTLNAILNQRSQDMLAANNWNVCQYAVLVHMFAQVSGLKAGELVHVIADAHIYDRHIPIIEKMLSEPEHPAPQFTLDPAVTDFYAFTPDSVRLENYCFSPFEDKIPIAV